MDRELSFDAMLDRVAALGEEEKETIDTAIEISDLIEILSEARIAKGLTQRQLAEKCGIKQSAIARIERVQVIPRLDTILRIAHALQCEVTINNCVDNKNVIADNIIYIGDYRPDNDYCWNQQKYVYQL